tara:strand:- start:150 stop:1205 length:1056 start_codon:yes stop_codon:yes gene_type:complete
MGFKRLDPEDFLISSDAVSQTVWSNNTATLNEFYTSSAQNVASISGDYYLVVYQTASNSTDASPQFDLAYGDKTSGGAIYFNDAVTDRSPSSTVYGQYRSLVLEDETADFTFGTATEVEYIYAMSIERSRYKEKLLPGSFNITLQGATGNPIYLTDNSKEVTVPDYFGSQRAYQIVRTDNANTFGTSNNINGGYTTSYGSYGLYLPDTGLIIFNGQALDLGPGQPIDTAADYGIGLGTNRALNTDANNSGKLYNAISKGASFKVNCEETLSSDFVFVRARNAEFNYSENPSYIQGTTGEVYWNYFINSPQSYITTVGLYNDNNDLLAVAKLSKPLPKDFTKEALIRVKLDF